MKIFLAEKNSLTPLSADGKKEVRDDGQSCSMEALGPSDKGWKLVDNGIGDPCMGAVAQQRIWHFGFGQFCKGPNYKAEEQPAFTLICCINSPFVGNPFDNLANGDRWQHPWWWWCWFGFNDDNFVNGKSQSWKTRTNHKHEKVSVSTPPKTPFLLVVWEIWGHGQNFGEKLC